MEVQPRGLAPWRGCWAAVAVVGGRKRLRVVCLRLRARAALCGVKLTARLSKRELRLFCEVALGNSDIIESNSQKSLRQPHAPPSIPIAAIWASCSGSLPIGQPSLCFHEHWFASG